MLILYRLISRRGSLLHSKPAYCVRKGVFMQRSDLTLALEHPYAIRARERSAASFAKHRRCAMWCTARPRRASLRCIRTSLPTPQYQKRFFCSCYRSLLQALPLRGRGVQRKEYLQSTPLCLRARGREEQRKAPSRGLLQAISCNRLRLLHALRGNHALPGRPLCQREYSPLRENAFAHEVSRL